MPDLTPKQIEHLQKIAAAEDEEAKRHDGRVFGFPGRAIAHILWPDSVGWGKVSRRGSTPAGGARGATMPMKGARAARILSDHGYIRVDYTSHHQALFFLTSAGRRYLERISNG